MADIAGMFISPFLQVCFEKMASSEHFLRGRKLNDGLLMRLKMKLESVIPVVEDAEGKQFMNPAVKQWLDRVKDVVYDAEDILDVIATEDLRRELEAEFEKPSEDILNMIGAFASQVWTTISTSSSVKEVESNVGELLERLEFLVKEKENLGLRADVGGKPLESEPTTSLVDESSIFGRHDDKNEIINSLLSDGASGDGMGVIALVGMGGIGKTTLAKLVYNDPRVKNHFEHKVWVCVSEEFNVLKLTKTILEEIGLRDDSDNLNQLQIKLKEKLTRKKILFVLDDVWNIKRAQWELLSEPFKSGGAQDRSVLITTRNEEVASVMSASKICRIDELPKEYCWLLFEKYAFKNLNHDARQEHKDLAILILEKCKGLPLAIKAIGSLLGSKPKVKEWVEVLRSELWHLPIEKNQEIGILPALSLSYKHLPPHIRRCFAYCAIFPKDYAFKKDTLVSLWMAEGFLPQLQNKAMKEVGDDYFHTLESRSLFQRSKGDKYIMHDLVNDLAKFIFGQFTLSHGDGCPCEIVNNTRHFSYYSHKFDSESFKDLHSAKKLRSIVNLGPMFYSWFGLDKGTQFPLLKLRRLRVLILARNRCIIELSDSIEELILLRYLDLSTTPIKRLPNSICKLCNLQILNLSNCYALVALPRDLHKLINLEILDLSNCEALAALPRDMHKLINLCHLDITRTAIMEIPVNLGKLKCLRTLPIFIVSKRSGSGIEELGKLTNLRGSLSVLELQNIESPADAKDAILRDKYLEELELKWRVDTSALESHQGVLHCLEPHSILRSLSIYGYGGTSFPNWVGDASFSSIASLRLENCKFCCSLPPLGQLPSLQRLRIVGLDGIVTVGCQFYSSGSSSMKPFGALEFLRFEKMLEWKEWFPFEAENEGGAFPNLRELWISGCPKLTGELPVHLPSLVQLSIHDCRRLVASLPGTSSRQKVTLSNCNTVILNESSIGIHELTIQNCLEPHSICLGIYGHGGTSFPNWVGGASFSSIASLRLENCKFCCSLPPLGQLPSLQRLWIVGLDGIVTVGCQFYGSGSSSMKPFGALEFLRFEKMLKWKEWFPFEAENEGGAFPNLRELRISGCPKLTGELPIHLPSLVQLSIHDCRRLVASLPGASSRHKVTLSDCNMVILNESSIGIHELTIQNCSMLEFPMHLNYSSLECLTLDHCSSLKSFPLIFSKIRQLVISYCGDLESLTVGEQHEHDLLLSLMDIRHCPNFAYFPQGGLRAPNLKHFSIWDCRNLRSLPDKMHMLLPSLATFYINDCPQVESFPEGGLPSNLNVIFIYNCDKLFANRMGWGLQYLSCVRRFSICGKSEDVESFPDEGLLPTSLTYLSIEGFPNLKSLEKKGFQHLTALEDLIILYCPNLEFMPEDGLPASLSTIRIRKCLLLTKELKSKEGPEWRKIAHVPNKHIDYYR